MKENIMIVFRKFPRESFTLKSLAKRMYLLELFVPYTMDVHVRQLYATKKLDRVARGLYRLNNDK